MKKLSAILSSAIIIAGCDQYNGVSVKKTEPAPVKVSSFGFDPVDSTRFIQAALDSGAKRIILDKQASPWISTNLYGRSNQEFIFEDGAEILAKRGEFKGLRDKLLNYVQCSNVVIRGMGEKGGTLRMWKCDYADPNKYKHAEWRYTLDIRGCSDVLVENMNCIASGGDGICIANLKKDGKSIAPKNITLRKCVMDDNYRQGLTVGCGENLLIEDCVMKNTRGTPPEAGVDIEPDINEEKLVNVVFRRCRAENNNGSGFEHYGQQLDNTSAPISIRFEECSTFSNKQEIAMQCGGTRDRNFNKGNIHFSRCTFGNSNKGNKPKFIVKTSKRGFSVTFDNCKGAENVKEGHPLSDAVYDLLGGKEPELATLPAVDKVKVVDAKPGAMVKAEPIELIGGGSLVFFAKAGEVAKFRGRQYTLIAGRTASTKKIAIARLNAQGEVVGKKTLIPQPGFDGGEFEFKAPVTAFYSMKISSSPVCFKMEEINVPTALHFGNGQMRIAGYRKEARPFSLHAVNFDKRETFIALQGDWYYKFACEIKDPTGKTIWERPLIEGPDAAKLPYAEGVWRLDFHKAKKPHYDWVTLDMPNSQALLFISSEKILKIK